MGKPTICIGENKGADQLRSNHEADQRLCFRYSDSTIPSLLNSKFQASSSFLCLYRPVCVRPGRKPRRPNFSCRGSDYKIFTLLAAVAYSWINNRCQMDRKMQISMIVMKKVVNFYNVVVDIKLSCFFSAGLLSFSSLLYCIAKQDVMHSVSSGKHVREMYTPLNPIFIYLNSGLKGYT